MYFVYILRSQSTGRYYVGQTDNLELRLKRHNSNMVRATKGFAPWELVYFEQYETRSEAMKREREIKNKKSRKYIEKLISNKTEYLPNYLAKQAIGRVPTYYAGR